MTIECPKCQTDNPDSTKFCGKCGIQLASSESISEETKTIQTPLASPFKTITGKYKILTELGRGGMGIVYKAKDTNLKRNVALKFLPVELIQDREAKKRFIKEAQAAAALNHPNICIIHEIDEANDSTFIAMEFIEGQTLKEMIESGPLEIEEAVKIITQVAEGLSEAHAKGIVHRDIKPANIMLTKKGHVKIVDFGLAKLSWGVDLTKTSTIMGTAAYMSPEQARGDKVDHRTDIWSLGAMLYEVLSGERPFKKDHEQALIYSILNEKLKSLSRIRSDVPSYLENVLSKAMEKDILKRYQSVDDFIHDIEHPRSFPSSKENKSIAVLPFVDMSPKKDQEYFCDGIAEELINALVHIKYLRVVARTSAFAFKGKNLDVREIGEKLNVSTILEGSIRKSGNRIRVTAQLIHVGDGYHLWSEKFDRELEDIFAIQDEISMAIVDHLKVKLLAKEKAAIEKKPTNDLEAYNFYLKGLHFGYQPYEDAFNKSINYFKKAIDRDPTFTLAYIGIAFTYGALGLLSIDPPAVVMPKAKAALEKALKLDESLAEVQAQSAFLAFWYDWDWKTAENSFLKAIELNPSYAIAHAQYSWFLLAMNRFDEAFREIKTAQELDPLLPLFYAMSVGIHRAVGKDDEAIIEFSKAIELDPNIGLAYFHLGTVYLDKGEIEKAFSAFQKSRELITGSGWAEAKLGHIYVLRGEKQKAQQLLNEMIEKKNNKYVSSFTIASLCSRLGKTDEAFEYLELAYKERDILMPYLNVYALSEFEKDVNLDKRFRMLLKKMNME